MSRRVGATSTGISSAIHASLVVKSASALAPEFCVDNMSRLCRLLIFHDVITDMTFCYVDLGRDHPFQFKDSMQNSAHRKLIYQRIFAAGGCSVGVQTPEHITTVS
jgi:hypothetical protein